MSKINVNLEGDFFEHNPEFMYFDEPAELVREYGKKKASEIMWAVYLSEDPTSKFYNFGKEDKRTMIQKNYLKDPDFSWESIDNICAAYPSWGMTLIERNYKSLNDTFSQMVGDLSRFDTSDPKEHKMALDLMKSIKQIFESLSVVSAMFEKEQDNRKNSRGQDQAGGIARQSFK